MNEDKQGSKHRHSRGIDRSGADRKPGLEARMTAARILAAVIDKKTSLDGMLDSAQGNPAYRALPDADRALVRAILQAALRHHRRIDAIFDSYLDKPLPEGATLLRHILSVAAAQILFLDIPDHSAVDLAVEHANADPRSRRFANLVNALLRRLGREKTVILSRVADVGPFPAWLDKRIAAAYGADAARAIAEASFAQPAIDITVKSDPAGWAERLGGIVLPTGSVRLPAQSGQLTELPGFAEGEWWVQDAASSIPARLFGDLAGQRVVDLCAAPGGKTAQLILAGAEVTALDQSASRIRRLSSNLERLGLSARIVEGAMEDHRPDRLYDAALLDAPCSSTGTIRRHPDIAFTKGPEDIAKLARLQARLLDHAIGLVRPGGTIVFSNCSLDPEEGERLIEALLQNRTDVVRKPANPANWPGLEEMVTPLGDIRTTPAMLRVEGDYPSGMDGFFASILIRVA